MHENLILFVEKAYKLEKSSFWKWATSKHGPSDINAIINGDWLAHNGLNEEALDSFCLNLRLLIQPKDGFSIWQIAKYSETWPDKYNSIKNEIKLAIEELDSNLSQRCLVQFRSPETTTNSDVFDVVFYGGIAHCNEDKREKFKILVNSGLFSYFVFQSFVSTLFHYRNCIKRIMRQIPDYLSMESVNFALFTAASRLSTSESKLEARLLLQHILNVNYAWLIAHADDTLTPDQYAVFETLLQRRLKGEPIAHILGTREFYGLPLKVTADTLIPRPDTETLVEAALENISPLTPINILDLGTGTGAIALAIAKHHPQAQVTAVDFSENALIVARENAKNLAIENVTFLQSSWFSALNHQRFDVIVSNPPYIAENDPHLTQGDVRFEPKSALTSGTDGLDDIRHIIKHAHDHLTPNGWLLLEHGYDQAQAVAELLAQAQFSHIGHRLDLSGIQRVTFGMVSPMIST